MAKRYPQSILASCEIPWDEDYNLMEDVFRQEVQATLGLGYNNLYIFGTAGEGYAVTMSRFKEIVELFREETDKPDVHPMVGAIGMSTELVVEKISFAHDTGFRMFQIALPPWGTLTDEEYMVYFKDVCGSFPDSKFLHYNLPRAGRVLEGSDYARLQDAIPNLVATKNGGSSSVLISGIVSESPELQHFLVEPVFPYGCLQGECSLLASLAAVSPTKVKQYFEYGRTGRFDELFKMQVEMGKVMEAFLGPLRGVTRIDGAYDKIIVRASGVDMPLRLLSPYQGVDLETYEKCVAALKAQYPDWLG